MESQLKPGLTHEEIYNRFAEQFKKLASEIMGDVITEYLPHAESDLDSNVYYRAMDYIAGEFGENTIFGSMGKRFRQRIFEENKELIIRQLDRDNLEKIAELEKEVAEIKTEYFERR